MIRAASICEFRPACQFRKSPVCRARQ